MLGKSLAILVVTPLCAGAVQAAEVYYDQFDWGLAAGNPGDLNTAFWSGPRDQMLYAPGLPVGSRMGAVELGAGGVYLSRLGTRSLLADFPALDYEFHACIRLTDFPEAVEERNAEIAFRTNGSDGYLLTIDGGQDIIRLRKQGDGYTDLVAPAAVSISPGDLFHLRVGVEGSGPVNITATVSANADLSLPMFNATHSESTWVQTGDQVQLIGFCFQGPYFFDVDYFSIGTPGYTHTVSDWNRIHYTDAPPEPTLISIGDLDSYDTATTGVLLHSGTAALRLTPADSGAVRVEFSPDGAFDFEPSWTALQQDWPPRPFMVTDTPPDPLVIAGEDWRIDVERTPLRLVFRKADGTLLLREAADIPTTAAGNLRQSGFAFEPDDDFYGMGGHSINSSVGLNRRGHSFSILNSHFPPSYLMFPFWTSPKGYGIHIDNPGAATLDMGATHPDRIVYVSSHGEYRYFVYFADDLYGVLDQHTRVTGRPLLAPRWTLGNIQSRFGYESFAQVQGIIDGFRTRDIPMDGIILDIDWCGLPTMGNLEFQTNGNWPNPATTLAGMRAQGVKLIPITEPQVTGHSFNAADVLSQGLVGTYSDGVTPYPVTSLTWITSSAPVYLMDFTKQAARDWWKQKHQRLIQDYEFAGFWQDLNEPEGQPSDMHYAAGPADAVRNVIALNMNRTLAEATETHAPGRRPFLMSRSGFTGMQRYGASVWSGDVNASWHDLAGQVPLACNMGLAGVPLWNSDIGGFNGTPSAELYTRWCQFAFFNPIYRPHANHDPREPWAFGPQAESAVTTLLRLRYRLIPHFYTISRDSHDTGAPIMRPLVMDWPADLAVRNLGTQYLYGPHLMAAPVTAQGEITKSVYMPAGNWMDWWTGQSYTGPTTATIAAPLDRFPILVRTPALIPMAPVMEYSDESGLEAMTLRVFMQESESQGGGHLYEDDGLTTGYQSAAFSTIDFEATRTSATTQEIVIGAATGSWPGMPATRSWEVEWVAYPEPPSSVALNAATLTARPDQTAYTAAAEGWYYDAATETLWVKGAARPLSSAWHFEFTGAPAEVSDWWILR